MEDKLASADGEVAQHMDGIYRYQRYIYDASRKYYLLGRDALVDGMKPPLGGRVLEVGCGTGRNLILAARRYPDAKFYGFDVSEMMLETARANIKRAGFDDRIVVAQGDAGQFSSQDMFGVEDFDRVFISYAISMIPPWREALPEAFKAVAPGGSLHIVDFGQQTGWPRWFRSMLMAWLAKFTVTPRAELEQELRKLADQAGAELLFTRLYRDYAQLAVVTKDPPVSLAS